MSSITKRQPRVKAPRSVRLVARVPQGSGSGLIRITEGGPRQTIVADDYLVNRVPSDFGDGFQLIKVGAWQPPYHIHLSEQGHACECKGFLRHDHCRHVAALVALRDAGKL